QGGAINNRQLNSSFESGAPPSDWTADAGLTVTQDSTYSIHKTYSAKLVADTSDRRYYQSRACTGYDPVGVYARLSDGSAVSSSNVVLLSRNDDTVSGASTTYTKITQDGWYRLGSRGATSGTCRYGVVVKANQTVWIDAYQQGDSNSENLVGHYVEATDATTTMGADQGLTYSTTNNFYKDQGTISFWYQNWDLNARGYVFGESGGNWEIRFQNGNTPLFTPDNATTSVTGSAMPNWNGTWQYMVITWDSSNIKIYQDGVQTGTTTAPASYTAIGASMGVGHTPEGSPFNNYTRCDCALSDFAIFNRALTATEVSQIYNSRAPLQDNFSNVAVVAQEATTGNMLSQPGGIFLASTATTVTANQLAANSLTSGTGLTVSSTATDVSSGTLFSLSKTGASGSTAFTGDIANIAYSQTFNGGTGLTSSGNVLDVSRAITLNNTGQTHTISGALVTIADSGTETAGDINNTSNVLNLAQNCGTGVTCSGAVLKIVNSGTGADISLANAETISNSTNGQINFGADKLDLDTTATSGNLLNISYDAAMTQAGALYGGYFDLFTNVTTGNNNQTGVYVKTRDGGASSTVVGLTLDGTADRGIDLSALNISTGGSILYNDTDSTIDLAATANNTLTIANSSGTTVNDNIVTLAVDANTDAADKILFRIISDVGGANTTVASIDSEGDIIANSITASQTHCTDCLDFADFVDAMTLDANLTLAQTTYTWTQTFTGTSGVGLTYNADSLTTGTVIKITSGDGLTTGGELIDLVADSMQSGGLITGSATALTSGYFLSFTGPSAGTVGVTGNIISLTSDVGNAGSIFKSTATFDSTAASASSYNIYASTTNSNATNANSAYGAYLTLSDAVALGNSDYGIYSTVTNTGANTLGTKNAYGVYGTVSNTSGGVGGSSNAYGGYFTATGDTGGTSTAYGIYATASGADTNYPAYFVTSQPTAVSGATGTNADALIGLSSAAGGNTTIATTGTGGVGSGLAWTLGTGGTAASANTASTGGAGGAYSLTSGTGGAAAATGTNIGGAGGAISLTGGTGGAASGGTGNTGGAGGAIDIVAGAAGSGGNANGGTLTLNSGAVTGSGTSTISIGSANVTTLNLGSANTTKTVNLGTGTGADTINIGTGATTADAITLGNTGVATTIDINSGAATVNALDITTDSVTTATALMYLLLKRLPQIQHYQPTLPTSVSLPPILLQSLRLP
ncbi:MAG: LamG domain-containing protein, partial [Candidatus Wildermuthbacteria bacterium]|nr:LamG domain-containing protein [Candidatus Wildermuthbacteria bacterium]